MIDGWYGDTLKGLRNTAKPYNNRQIYPRKRTLHRGQPGPLTYNLAVTAPNFSDYVFTGHDRNSGYTSKTDPNLSFKKGDIINFEMNASGHPFWIKTSQTTGTGNQYNTGVTNNGTATGGTITWDTSAVPVGTYYYICQLHGSMTGSIFIT